MALLTRARGIALAGATALAVALPISPMAPAPAASAVPAPRVSVENSVAAAVATSDRKKKTSRSARSFAARASRVMATGNSLKGVPYRRGGTTPRGFDCSGIHVLRLPQGRHQPAALSHRPDAPGAAHLPQPGSPGDLVFFRSGRGAYHVGIYAGNNRTLHSPRPGGRVSTVHIWSRNVSFGRVL